VVLLLIYGFICCNNSAKSNPLVGKWRSARVKKGNKVDFSLDFWNDYNFKVKAYGGPAIIEVSGVYNVKNDTLMIKDNHHEPVQICNYSDTGIYTFTRSNDSLFFKVIEDKCERRKFTLTIGLVEMK
jgi:hypothetical protein